MNFVGAVCRYARRPDEAEELALYFTSPQGGEAVILPLDASETQIAERLEELAKRLRRRANKTA